MTSRCGESYFDLDQKMPAIHALTAAEVLARLRVSGVTGLPPTSPP
jgi:hypothetical protein